MNNKKSRQRRLFGLYLLAVILTLAILALLILLTREGTAPARTTETASLSHVTPSYTKETETQGPAYQEFIGPNQASEKEAAGPNRPAGSESTISDSADDLADTAPTVFDSSASSENEAAGPNRPDDEPSDIHDHEDEGALSPAHGSLFSDQEDSDSSLSDLLFQVTTQLPQNNGKWAVYISNLSKGTDGSLNNEPMQAASLIKLFIMGAVYENYDALCQQYGTESMYTNLHAMITVSDNDAANTLVTRLGSGNSTAGMQKVNSFCQIHGYTNTSMGRLLLQGKENGDNYTSVADCGRFLKEIYQLCQGTVANTGLSHAKDMYELLKQQTRKNKIPANMPENVQTANKTGELSDVENDAAIITGARTDLVICFMSENLTETGSAQSAIAQYSRLIYDYYNGQ